MLIKRVVTAVIFGVAVVAAIAFLPSRWAGIILGGVWLVGAYEWSGFALQSNPARFAFVLANAIVMAAITRVLHNDTFIYWVLAVAAIWWLLAVAALFAWPRKFAAPVVIAAGLATLLPSWGLLAWLHSHFADGPVLILMLLGVVWAADSGAFFAGRALGRHKLAPHVSPGKTWEGVLGGIVTAALVAALAGWLIGAKVIAAACVGAATAALSVVGDLNVSLFKRNAGLKDSGRLLPGHGGLLDRADSVTAAVAMFVLGLIVAGIIT